MALPTISSNSPSAGYITWTSCNVTWDGGDYVVPAGNTNKKFTWWQYNGGAPTLEASDSLPTLAAEDILLFLNKNGVGVLVPTTDVTDGSLIVTGSILAPAIAADQIETYHINAGAVTATEIGAGAIQAGHVAAGAITTDKLSVGTVGDSLVTNGSFEEFASGMPVGWSGVVQGGTGSVDIVTGVASSGTNAARLVVGATITTVILQQLPTRFVPVTSAAGRKWYIAAMVGAGTATTRGLHLRAVWYDANKQYISFSDALANLPVTTSFQLFEGQVTPPSTARYMGVEVLMNQPNVITNVYVDEVVAREVVIAAQIGDGQITTPKLVANAVTANELAAGSVNAKHMLISDFTNLVQDPLLTRPLATAWVIGEPWSRRSGAAGASNIVSTVGLPGNAFKLDGVSTEVSVQGDWFEVQGLQEYFVSCKAQQQLTGSSPLGYMRIDWFSKDRSTTVGSQFSMTIPVQGWGALGTTAIAPTDAYYGRLQFIHGSNCTGGSWWVGNPQIRRMNGGELIVDGEITATKLAANSVTATKILAGTIATSHMTAGTINADRLSVNTITGDRIAANTIMASKLAVGDFENLATINEITGVTIATNGQTQIVGGYNTKVNDGDAFFMFKERTPGVPFLPGEKILVKFTAKATVTPASCVPTIWVYDAAGANTATAAPSQTVNATDTDISVIITPGTPTNPSKEWVIGISGFANKGIGIKNVVVRRMNAGELIVDGAITANKILAGSIGTNHMTANTINADRLTANTIAAGKLMANSVVAGNILAGEIGTNHLAANSVTAGKILAGEIGASHIAANAITANKILAGEIGTNHLSAGAITAAKLDADAINGKTITGATVRTAASGARVVMDTSGLGAWNTAGTKYLTADANGLSIDGTITSTGGTNWLGESVVVKTSKAAATSGGRNIAGVSFEKAGASYAAFPAVYSDAGTDLMLTSANNQAFLSLANENSGGEAELQGQGINLFCNTGNVNIGKTYNTAGNLNVDKINGHKASKAIIVLNKTGTQTLTTANSWYDVGWNSVPYKNLMTHSTSTNNHQITIQYSGVYTVSFKIAVNQNTGQVSGAIAVNGTQQANSLQRVGNNSGQYEKASSSQQFVFNAGDVITIQASSGFAGALADNVNIASISSEVLF